MKTYNNQQLLQEFLQRISWTPESGQQGYKTTLEGLNRQTGCLQPGRCYLFVGPDAVLNRAFLSTIVHDLCWRQQLSTRWICCKQLAGEVIPLLLSRETGIPPFLLSAEKNREQVQKTVEKFQSAPLDIWETNTSRFLDDAICHIWGGVAKQLFIVEDLDPMQMGGKIILVS